MAKPIRGLFPNGMAYGRWGTGTKSLLAIPGGPGNHIPQGMGLRMQLRSYRLFVEDGYTVWLVTRRQNMPRGHSIRDMAADYARLIEDEFDGSIDLVIGTSYGGVVAQYLAADHPDRLRHVVIVAAGWEVPEEGARLDSEFASCLSHGDNRKAGAVIARGLFSDSALPWLAGPIGSVMGMIAFGNEHEYFKSDVLIEAEAEAAFDSRSALPRIEVPVLLICGDQDNYFPMETIEETARLIPRCTLAVYEGKGHVGAISHKRLPRDVMEFVADNAT